ncbi:YifB family Mg chelatase-like AAA ATPase [Tessaracoccus antarcticus]|uniref:ATP-binding protein n=1 Tax=Tessaracoccus antarcticus TaxID=2479848 RepID=A0A3M0G5H7_9ACTN|nr:YifB family Mg chelatase-like AAA ATPase [Tessaracoccus antarcticus]RMB59818.1 ATP-binding protein [Tessaracoccus antarcticus]
MRIACAWSVSLSGLEGSPVQVEAATGQGLPKISLVGLPDAALLQARDRVRAAISGAAYEFPKGILTINLSPANLPKNGSHYDLAIAAAILAATEEVPSEMVKSTMFFGELGLDGNVRRMRGILPAMLAASRAGFQRVIVPHGQAREASLVPGLTIWPVRHLHEMVDLMHGRPIALAPETCEPDEEVDQQPSDFADVQGHSDGKWAMEVAAAGRHHVFLHGAPGVGKTMLASRLPSILPDLGHEDAIEVSALHSLAGRGLESGLLVRPPYSDPHHTSTMASLIGGGGRDIRPGSISLAHRGVLFLDEAPEFGSRTLDALRTPLENGWVTIGRVNQVVRYPARFQLILAANPCPCGYSGVVGKECTCPAMTVRRYRERLSGPILDRIDIRHHMLPLTRAFLADSDEPPETSVQVLTRVMEARGRQQYRLMATPWCTNGEVPGSYLRKHLPLPEDLGPLERGLSNGTLSARGVDKVLRLAWTLADLEGEDRIGTGNLRVAMLMRQGELARVG